MINKILCATKIICYSCVPFTIVDERNDCNEVTRTTNKTKVTSMCVTVCDTRNHQVTRLPLTADRQMVYSGCPYFFPWDHELYCETCYWDFCNNKNYSTLVERKPKWRTGFKTDFFSRIEVNSLIVFFLPVLLWGISVTFYDIL